MASLPCRGESPGIDQRQMVDPGLLRVSGYLTGAGKCVGEEATGEVIVAVWAASRWPSSCSTSLATSP